MPKVTYVSRVKELSPDTVIVLSSREFLLSPVNKQKVAQFLSNEKGDFIVTMINTLRHFKGTIQVSKHYILHIHMDIVEDAIEDFEWIHDVQRFSNARPKRRSKETELLRFQLIDAVQKIMAKIYTVQH